MKYLNKTEINKLTRLFNNGQRVTETKNEYWIHGDDDDCDEGESYCRECCELKIANLKRLNPENEYCVCGGYGIQGDGVPWCENCGCRLWNSFTEYACESEVENFLMYGFDPFCHESCAVMERVVDGRGWRPFCLEIKNKHEREASIEYFDNLHTLCRVILKTMECKK